MKHVVGRRQVEAKASRTQRQQEDRHVSLGFLEPFHHRIALTQTASPVQEQDFNPQCPAEDFLQQHPHFAILGEDQRAVPFRHNLLKHFRQPVGLAAAMGWDPPVVEKVGRVIAYLF